ncbi:hypothetical protein DPEC_G00168050 [Dallia pectoralis]|uniref:Uncharacterized protein n=1 Tax=Dallia pectoralis TaxID=75939 RepID=A0ACC2GII9_DALPE|nr:hypothetical protein DPEC_G00168050 [Dallia pectoralis]
MNPSNGTLSNDQITDLSTLYQGSLSLSLIGSFSVLVVSIARWRQLQKQWQPLVQLALADLLAGVILMFTSSMNGTHMFFIHNVSICEHLLPLSLTFYFVSLLLVVVYAWESHRAVEGWRERPREEQCTRSWSVLSIYTFVWSTPWVMYFMFVITFFLTTADIVSPSNNMSNIADASKYCTSCILFLHIWTDHCSDNEQVHDIFVRCFLFFILTSVLVFCSVVYYKVGSWYRRYEEEGLFPVEGDARSRKRLKGVFITARNMILTIIFCWMPAMVLVVLSVIPNIPQEKLFPLYVLQAVTVSLQGFLNSMVYAWRRPNFREAVLGETMPLLNHEGPMPFFDESLRAPFGPSEL